MSDGARLAPATGYLFVMPDGAVARLAAGGGSAMLTPAAAKTSLALDYDSRAAATLSGTTAPGDTAHLRVDGGGRGDATADARGRFVLLLNEPLTPGQHDFDLADGAGNLHFVANIAMPSALHGPFATPTRSPADGGSTGPRRAPASRPRWCSKASPPHDGRPSRNHPPRGGARRRGRGAGASELQLLELDGRARAPRDALARPRLAHAPRGGALAMVLLGKWTGYGKPG